VVDRWRQEHDPVASAGVPAHVTLIVPWLPPDEISDVDLAELAEEVADEKIFDFDLVRVGWFGRKVLWLAPEPAEVFRTLTNRLAERFATPPWDDEFDEIVPHLTIGHASDGVELAPVADALSPLLPIRCRAEELWVMVGDGQRWSRRWRTPLQS
jgi:2'-5' RNA ligase